MAEVVAEARRAVPDIERVVLWHRTGELDLSETSVLIVVAAPHRREAFAAAELTRDGKDDGAAVARAWHRDKTGTIDAVVRTAQDYAFGARGHRSRE